MSEPQDDPPPEDGELGYTAPLEGTEPPVTEADLQAPGQITLLELLGDEDPQTEPSAG